MCEVVEGCEFDDCGKSVPDVLFDQIGGLELSTGQIFRSCFSVECVGGSCVSGRRRPFVHM